MVKKVLPILFLLLCQTTYAQYRVNWTNYNLMNPSNDVTRSIAYNRQTDHVLVATRKYGTDVIILNAANGDSLGKLNTDIITGGTYPINMVSVTGDGSIYVSNLAAPQYTPGATFRVYRYDSEESNPELVFDNALDGGRYGDSFAAVGTGTDTYIYSSGMGNSNMVVLKDMGSELILDHYIPLPSPGDRPRRPRRRVPRHHAGARMNGWRTLLYKEVLRFWKVSFQTVAAPVLTAVLYLLIFGHVLEDHVKVYDRIGYTSFLIPGLVMMSVLQNAFANSSSSLIQSKITGNLVFLLVTPLSHWAWFSAYVGASMVRGLVVGAGVLLVTVWFAPLHVAEPWWIVAFAVLGAAMLGSLGLIAGLWAEKFDQMAGFQNFIIMPMTFLSGVFYSVHSLPGFWQAVSHLNPFFYMIDGFRHGFFGVSDVSPWISLGVVATAFVLVAGLALQLLRTGYKLRH